MDRIDTDAPSSFYSILIVMQRLNSVVMPAMILIVPKTAMGWIFILGFLSFPIVLPKITQIFEVLKSDSLALAVVAFIFYLIVNSIFAVDLGDAFSKLIIIALILLIVVLAPIYQKELPKRLLNLFSIGLVMGVSIGIAFLFIEVPFGSPIASQIIQVLPVIDDEVLRLANMKDGKIIGFHRLMLNKNIAILVLLIWPTVLALRLLSNKRLSYALMGTIVLASMFLIFLSENETSLVAFVLGILIYLMVRISPRFSYYITLIAFCFSMLLAVPIAKIPFTLGYQNAQWLPISARDRFYIWKFTADKVSENPILGVGIRGTRHLEENASRGLNLGKTGAANGKLLTQRLGNHAHNIFLQTWFELGALGAIFFTIVVVLIIMRLSQLRSFVRPYGYALFTVSVTLGFFGFGMWKTWLLSSMAIATIVFLNAKQFELLLSKDRPERSY